MQFLGNIDAKIDAKMRVFVPATFRKVLSVYKQQVLVLRKDIFQNCLVLYPEVVWEREVEMLRSRLSRWDKFQQQIFRQFVVDAERLDLDSNGRILIPKRCLQMIGADLEVQFLGVDNTMEIWGRGRLDESLIAPEEFASEIQQLMAGGELDE